MCITTNDYKFLMIIYRVQIRAHAHAWMYVCTHIINYTFA